MKRAIKRHLILLKHYKQLTVNSCGVVCLRMLLERFGKEYSEKYLKGLGYCDKEGMDEIDIRNTLEKIEHICIIYNYMSFADLINKLNENIPLMVGFQEHWQIVVGYDEKYMFIVNPNYKSIKRINKERFLKLWKTENNQALEIR